MEPLSREVKGFITATEVMLSDGVISEELNETEWQLIQYYLTAMAEKFPSRTRA